MSVMPQPILEPLVFMSGNNGVSGLGSVKKKPEIWHIQVDQNIFHEPRSQHRENPSKVSQLEKPIQFMNKQHNEFLRSLQAEIDGVNSFSSIEEVHIQKQNRVVDPYEGNSGPETENEIPKHFQKRLIFARK